VVLKYTPTLKFLADDSIVRGNRVLQIIDELEKDLPGKTEGNVGQAPSPADDQPATHESKTSSEP
jgi:hypothetical protein